ncbi:MAG: hypothetical protein NZ581_09110 [Candidatus Caldarchaeum sp.]|nr:hypothetical protein [Candidatus Caldarchaeum sp.]MDW8436331.1 hypothetical protein [Candidatus Caldarchaeum sp.]
MLSAVRMNFSGLYLMGVDWSSGEAVFDSAALLISEIGKLNREYGLEIFVEIDAVATAKYPKVEESFLKNSNYVVVLTSPFNSSIKNPLHGNFTIQLYKSHLERVSSAAGNSTKILFSVLAMDIAEGWMSPALQLQVEVNEFSSVKGVKGYAIYHASRYLPVRISFN